jgi:hypothetical protein
MRIGVFTYHIINIGVEEGVLFVAVTLKLLTRLPIYSILSSSRLGID